MLLFNLGNSQYAIPACDVVEVAPLVRLDSISMVPDYVAGLFHYRDEHVPVLDLCKLIAGRYCEDSITTRVILVKLETPSDGARTLGLLAERVTETLSIDSEEFSGTGIDMSDAPFLGEAAGTDKGLIQKITISELLPDSVRAILFPAETG
jgi:chemotaxis-related protein WspB